jgi:hypothetical protein
MGHSFAVSKKENIFNFTLNAISYDLGIQGEKVTFSSPIVRFLVDTPEQRQVNN